MSMVDRAKRIGQLTAARYFAARGRPDGTIELTREELGGLIALAAQLGIEAGCRMGREGVSP